MKHGAGAILMMGFGGLVVLIAALGFGAFHRANQIEDEIASIHDNYRRSALVLSRTKEDAYKSGIIVRDYLLDPSTASAPEYRRELLAIRESLVGNLGSLYRLISRDESGALDRLKHELDSYWDSLDPVFEWDARQKSAMAYSFLRRNVIPRRNAVFAIMREIDELSSRTFASEQEKINASRTEFQTYLWWMSLIAVLLAFAIAGVSIYRVTVLEQRTEKQRERAENAERELRRLSHQLVQAQEEERKSISRELHDEIGQMLTGLKMELGNLQALKDSPPDEFERHLAEGRAIAEQAMRAVRNLAMGLRPSMLDDLGLDPALRWQAHEFSRRTGVPVSMELDGELDGLSEAVRTCVYRVVQESLTNCARHAEASNVRVTVHGGKDALYLTIQDDGKGFDPGAVEQGLGLVGMEERVKKLGGRLKITSCTQQDQKGTILEVEIPLAGGENT